MRVFVNVECVDKVTGEKYAMVEDSYCEMTSRGSWRNIAPPSFDKKVSAKFDRVGLIVKRYIVRMALESRHFQTGSLLGEANMKGSIILLNAKGEKFLLTMDKRIATFEPVASGDAQNQLELFEK